MSAQSHCKTRLMAENLWNYFRTNDLWNCGAHNCGSGGRWFESTQLYQRNQSLRQRLLTNCPPNVDNGKRTVIKDHGFDSGGNSVFGFEAIRGRGGLTGNRTARLGERETRSTGSLGGPRRFAHQALSCKGERSS